MTGTHTVVFSSFMLLLFTCASQDKLWQRITYNAVRLYQAGKYDQAAPVAEEGYIVAKRSYHRDHPNLLAAINCLVTVLFAQGKYNQAEPYCREAIAISERLNGPGSGKYHPAVQSRHAVPVSGAIRAGRDALL